MKILIISQYFWPENFRISDLAAGLVERGHQITILTGIPNYPSGHFFSGYGLFRHMKQDFRGAKVIRVPLIPRGNANGFRLAINYLSFMISACVFAPFLCREKFHVIFVCQLSPVTVGIPALLMKKLKRIPVLFWVQDLWPESLSATGAVRSKVIIDGVRKLVRFIYKHCDKILVQSPAFKPMIEKQQVVPGRIAYFPNSVEKIYQPMVIHTDIEGQSRLPSGFNVMFAGNIGFAQDFETILSTANILRKYRDINWIILGDGRARHWVELQVVKRELTDSVHLLGGYPMETMPQFFSLADVMLVTLKREPILALTIPSKIQSYMACGRPIVAALDGEGARVIRESGAGIACPAEDSEGLAVSILGLYRMPKAEREAMGAQGVAYCKINFEREMLIDRLEDWMKDLCQKNKSESFKSP